MMISLCSYLFDYFGNYLLKADLDKSDFTLLSRRVSRSATLDGGALIIDNGYSASDATFSISVSNLSLADRSAILATLQQHSLVVLSCKTGCFLGVVERVDESQGFKISFLVKSQLN